MNKSLRIDAHQHYWYYSPEQYRWIHDEVLMQDYLPADLKPQLAPACMDATVAVQARQSLEENTWLLELAEANPYIVGVVGWVDLADPDLDAQLDNLCANPCFCGIRANCKGVLKADGTVDTMFSRGMQALTARNLAFDLLLRPPDLAEVAELIARFPEQRFVLDHIGNPPIASQDLEPWATDLRRLATNPNVACKVSGMVTNAEHYAWQQQDFVPYLDVIFGAFGTERLLIGSDWPVCRRSGEYGPVMGIVQIYIASLPVKEQQAILGGNAVRWYNLKV